MPTTMQRKDSADPTTKDHPVPHASSPADADGGTLGATAELREDFPCTYFCDLLCSLPYFAVQSWKEAKKRKISAELTKCHDEGQKIYLGCSVRETVIGETEEQDVVWIDIRGRFICDAIGTLYDILCACPKEPYVKYLNVIVGCNLHGVGKGILKQAVMRLLDRDKTIRNDPKGNVICIKVAGRTDFESLLSKPAAPQ